MALIECPECGKEISDKAESCPHCGFSISKTLSHEREKYRAEDCAAGRITKTSCGKFKFFSQDKEHVNLTCATCERVFMFKRGYFRDITDEGATPLIPLSCPKCSSDSASQKGKECISDSNVKNAHVAAIDSRHINGEENGFQRVIGNVGCGVGCGGLILGVCGMIAILISDTTSVIPLDLMIAGGVCFIVGDVLFWMGRPEKPPRRSGEKNSRRRRAPKGRSITASSTPARCAEATGLRTLGQGRSLSVLQPSAWPRRASARITSAIIVITGGDEPLFVLIRFVSPMMPPAISLTRDCRALLW